MSTNNVKYRLGLDMGTNSIGWAAVKLDTDGKPCGILDMGVRIFPDGRNPTDKTSNAVERRLARGQRRRRDRYLKRREKLLSALVEYGLMPQDENERKAIANDNLLDPYELRARALDYPLSPFELGRSIFHIDQRRGFKSNRKAAGDDNEAKKTRADIDELRRRIEQNGARTLGEYLYRRRKKGKSVRARPDMGLYPDRALYEDEFDKIQAAQQPHQDMDADRWASLREIIFYQRPLEPVDSGLCLFEDGEHRAARALPLFQEFRMLQEVANLKIRVGAEPDRFLHHDERERSMERLRSGKDITLSKGKNNTAGNPTRDLGLPSGATFNLAAGGRKAIKGDETAAKLAAEPKTATEKKPAEPGLFGKKWPILLLDERNEIVKFLLNTEEPDAVREKAIADWGLNEAQAVAVSNVSLVSGYGNLSEKAIRKILPHMQKGLGYSDAVLAAGYLHHSDFRNAESHERLPYYGEVLPRDAVGADPTKDPEKDGEPARYGRIANPTVHIGLNQLRRVVNRLTEVHGKPEEIVVELARDLKMNREQKRNYEQRQREGAERNNRFTENLESSEETVSAQMLHKLRIWEEQKDGARLICPYTGQTISFNMVVSAQTEIDHILPFSRTLDNSVSNMVVCMVAANRAKGDRSPYEAFGHNPPGYDYDEILANVADFPANKRKRFQADAMERFESDDAFLDRQLNETQYLSRTARTYLAHLYDEKTEGIQRVRAIPGRMTALLRRGWGLNGMLSEFGEDETTRKQRDDHRHHAIDAFVVANTTPWLLHQFARAAGSSWQDAAKSLAKLTPPPWEGFSREHLKPYLDNIVVSYKPDHGTRGAKAGGATTGQLHNETAYGIIELVEDGQSEIVVRKPLSSISRKALAGARDPALKSALLELWDEVGGSKSKFAERAEHKGVLVNGRRQKVRRVRIVETQRVIPIRDGAGNPYKAYLPGGNEFADIWRMRDGSWQTVVVPTFDANQPSFDIEKFRPRTTKGKHKGKPDPTARRLMRLQIDDMGAFGEGMERRVVRVRKITNAKAGVSVVLDEHNEANVPARITRDMRIRRETGIDAGMKEKAYSTQQLRRFGFRKIHVDEIGRVRDSGPFAS